MTGLEEPLTVELLLQLLESCVQISRPVRREGGTVELIAAVPRENRNPSKGQDLHTIFRAEAQGHGFPPVHYASDDPSGVLQ